MFVALETLKTVATLCQIIAGDNPSMTTMDNLIQLKQVRCHAYYAACVRSKPLDQCMIERMDSLNKEYEEAAEKLRSRK